MTDQNVSRSARTVAVTAGRPQNENDPLNASIVLASNFQSTGDYARTHGTSTWAALETAVGELEGGQCLSFATGMAAASAILFALNPSVVVLPTVSYLGVRALLGDMQEHGHVRVVSVDIVETNAVTQAMNEAAAQVGAERVVLWIETPTNPTLDEAELELLCRAANASNVKTVVDSTFASPIGQQPLKLGASVVMHSGTKFIGGHSDLMIGLALTQHPAIFEKLSRARVVQGATPGALEAFLALRGLRTLPLRYEAASKNADEICRRLQAHSAIEWAKNVGPMLSYIVKGGAQAADKVCASASMIITATSLGGVETTMERRQKYAGDAHVNPGLIRMSVGIEDVEDIWSDLEKALAS
jgi:cystathionine gamma-synthase